ncbi:zinc transporter SLC39A7-like [Cydia splendana]|uniref:zinc transporter SLC39A7-like n=1 Tax=Cydia splendana TaxID=1100963 RepID=UPI00300D51F0
MCGVSGEFLLRILLLNFVYIENNFVTCEELPNNVFNANIRDYYVKEDDNLTNVKTLQKEEVGRYASFAPIRNPIRFKEIPDNALSSSSYSRGLLHHDHGGHHEGYGIHDGYYEDGSPYGHGYAYIHDDHDYDHDGHGHGHGHGHEHGHEHGHGHGHEHGHGHGGHGHYGHHLGHGHYKHHDHHHLATKALLWPIAGIALLGAAAALVTNPVLLQLGVVSGKRRRRDTLEISGESGSDENWPLDPYSVDRKSKKGSLAKKVPGHVSKSENNRFVPIPLKFNKEH